MLIKANDMGHSVFCLAHHYIFRRMPVTLSTPQQRNPVTFHFMAYVQRYISTVSYELIKLNTGEGFAMRRGFSQVSNKLFQHVFLEMLLVTLWFSSMTTVNILIELGINKLLWKWVTFL